MCTIEWAQLLKTEISNVMSSHLLKLGAQKKTLQDDGLVTDVLGPVCTHLQSSVLVWKAELAARLDAFIESQGI